jgi:hypothetical protein
MAASFILTPDLLSKEAIQDQVIILTTFLCEVTTRAALT